MNNWIVSLMTEGPCTETEAECIPSCTMRTLTSPYRSGPWKLGLSNYKIGFVVKLKIIITVFGFNFSINIIIDLVIKLKEDEKGCKLVYFY